ncbi:MAG: polysaccharide deacetylase family protein [archaeon]
MILEENMNKKILLSFDLEEFDLPLEYGWNISENEQFKLSLKGFKKIKFLLDEYKIPCTFFTTASFAKKYPKLLKELSKEHEIACHGLSHSNSNIGDLSNLKLAKKEIEKIIKKPVNGFRAPRWDLKYINLLNEAGFDYDSSSHPIYLPGRYFNLNRERDVHKIGNLIEIPLSTLPPNFSLFWLAFRNFPFQYAKLFTIFNFTKIDYTTLLFHPWEFVNISNFKIPFYVKRKTGNFLLKKLERYLLWCKSKNYQFSTFINYLNKFGKI